MSEQTTENDALRRLASDWQANGNSRELGDPTAGTWHEAARRSGRKGADRMVTFRGLTRWLRRATGRCEFTGKRVCPWHPDGGNHPGTSRPNPPAAPESEPTR